MISISKKTGKSRNIIRKSIDTYFGESGLGLNQSKPQNYCAYFEGGGGFVAVEILDEDDNRVINIQSREWEYHVKQFLLTV